MIVFAITVYILVGSWTGLLVGVALEDRSIEKYGHNDGVFTNVERLLTVLAFMALWPVLTLWAFRKVRRPKSVSTLDKLRS